MKSSSWTTILLVLVCWFACTAGPADAHNEAPARPADERAEQPLVIGLIPQLSAVAMVKQWQPFMNYLSKELNRPVDMVLKSNYQSVISGLERSEMDMALLGSLAYVSASTQLKIRPLVKRVIDGSPSYHSIVIVRKDSGIDSLAGLKGRSFAFTDTKSTTGYLLPYAMLDRRFGNPERFFSRVMFTGNHDSALTAVCNGTVDGASVSTTRWNPANQKLSKLKIIWKSEPIPLGPFVVRKQMNPDLAAKIKQAFLKFGTDETAALARQIKVDGFVPAHDNDYDVIRRISATFKHEALGD